MMDTKELISLGSAIVSFLSLVGTIIFALRAGASARSTKLIAMGSAESSLRTAISTTRQRVEDRSLQVAEILAGKKSKNDLTAPEKRRLEPVEKAFISTVDYNLNAYEEACAKYLDGKIDKGRFKKTYVHEIQKLCEQKGGPVADFMNPEGSSKFHAIWKVFRQWHIHEK